MLALPFPVLLGQIDMPIDVIQSGGIVALVLFLLWSGARDQPLWVFGRTHREQLSGLQTGLDAALTREREWMNRALRALNVAELATGTTEKVVDAPHPELMRRLQAIEAQVKKRGAR